MAKVAGLHVNLSANSADFRNDLRANTKELRRFGAAVNRQANRVKYAFNKIRRAAQVIASAYIFAAGIRSIGKFVAAMAKAEDQVKLIEARFQQFARTGDSFTRIYNLSKDLGVSLQSTADGMTRLLVATKEIGTAQSVLEDVHKNIVILGRAGGTSAEEMKGAMRQLSQGLASGRLQGEELRSVLENLPLVAIEIAKQMDIPLGKIREAAAEGKIIPQVIIDALSEIEIKMEDLPQTWAMQTENLRTEWDLFLSDLSDAVDEAGLLDSLVEAVKWVRINLLGSLKGVRTEIVKSQMLDQEQVVRNLKKALDKLNFDPNTQLVPPAINAPGVVDPNAGLRQLVRQYEEAKDRLDEYNKELERRAKLEKLAAEAAAAKAEMKLTVVTPDMVRNEVMDQQLAEFRLKDAADELAGAWERINKAVEKHQQEITDAADAIRQLVQTDVEEYISKMREARELLALGPERGIDQETFNRYQEFLLAQIEGMDDLNLRSKETFDAMQEYSKQAARNMQDAFADFLFDPFADGVKGMLRGFLDAIRRMLANQAALQLFEMLAGIGGPIGSFFALAGGRAMGGPVSGGNTYLVGENGPELLAMGAGTSGMVVPNHALVGSGVGHVFNFTTNINNEGPLDAVTLIPILDENNRKVKSEFLDELNRGKYQ